MKRRQLVLATLGACAVELPPVVRAQQATKPKLVAWLAMTDPDSDSGRSVVEAFKMRLRELGWIEGRNIAYEIRWTRGKHERLPDLGRELVALAPDVIYTIFTDSAIALQDATKTIPIIVGSASDPVGAGLAQSLARPGGNITGISNLSAVIGPKLVELLRDALPKVARVAVLWNPANPGNRLIMDGLRAAALPVGISLFPLEVQTPFDIERAFQRMSAERVEAVIVTADSLFYVQARHIDELLARHRLPSVVPARSLVLGAGGLMNYGQSPDEFSQRSASYVDRILKGAKPADLPIEQPTRFLLVINMKVARALGLAIPQKLLLRADEVIE